VKSTTERWINSKKDNTMIDLNRILESLREGEYYIWKVHFQDGTSKNVKIKWDETSKEQLETHFGKPISNIEYSWSIHNDDADNLVFRRDFMSQNPLDRNVYESDSDFVIGNTIRTNASGMTGVIEKIIPNSKEVYFRLQDGRLMKTSFNNVTPIEKLADENEEIAEAVLNEISNEVLAKYKTAAGKSAIDADKKGDFKTGNKRFSGIIKATKKQFSNDTKQKKLNELSVNSLNAYKDAASNPEQIKHRPLRKLAKTAKAMPGVIDRICTKTGDKRPRKQTQQTYEERLSEFVNEVFNAGDVYQPTKKTSTVDIPYNNWTIRYKTPEKNKPVPWLILNKKSEIVHRGESVDDKEAVRTAQEWINKGAGKTDTISNNVTIDFNGPFSREISLGETFYGTIINDNGIPLLFISDKPQKGLKTSHTRAESVGDPIKFSTISLTPKEAQEAGLQKNGRYILGDKDDYGDGLSAFPLLFQGVTQSKEDRLRMSKPGLTVASSR